MWTEEEIKTYALIFYTKIWKYATYILKWLFFVW